MGGDSLYGLAFGCPFIERDDSCPLKEVDNLTLGEKYQWVSNLDDEDKFKLLDFHFHCSIKRT